MALVSFGDLAHAYLLRTNTARLKSDLDRVTQELASGKTSDVAKAVTADFSRISAISRSRELVAGLDSAARDLALTASTMQAVFGAMQEHAGDIAPELLMSPQSGTRAYLSAIAENGRNRLGAVMSGLNTTAGGRSVLAGVAVDQPATIDSDALLALVRTEIAGEVSGADAMARLSAWFDDPAGFEALAYTGGAPLVGVDVSSSDRVTLDFTALDPAVREALKGFTAAALIDDPVLALSDDARRDFGKLAGEALLSAQDEIAATTSRLGVAEAAIERARTRNGTESATLQLAEAEVYETDPYALATELEAVQTNLETLYAVTARLSRMSLADFL